MFIDKYNQVARILGPIVICLNQVQYIQLSSACSADVMHACAQLDDLDRKPDTHAYIKATWGNLKHLRMVILCDFFRHAFDGSGADNFFGANQQQCSSYMETLCLG